MRVWGNGKIVIRRKERNESIYLHHGLYEDGHHGPSERVCKPTGWLSLFPEDHLNDNECHHYSKLWWRERAREKCECMCVRERRVKEERGRKKEGEEREK